MGVPFYYGIHWLLDRSHIDQSSGWLLWSDSCSFFLKCWIVCILTQYKRNIRSAEFQEPRNKLLPTLATKNYYKKRFGLKSCYSSFFTTWDRKDFNIYFFLHVCVGSVSHSISLIRLLFKQRRLNFKLSCFTWSLDSTVTR